MGGWVSMQGQRSPVRVCRQRFAQKQLGCRPDSDANTHRCTAAYRIRQVREKTQEQARSAPVISTYVKKASRSHLKTFHFL